MTDRAPVAGPNADTVPDPHATPGSAQGLPIVDPRNYDLRNEIARGGMGRIRVAFDRRLGRTVAIKELLTADPIHAARLEREALVSAQLQHPSIVSVHEAGRWPNGLPFLAMELVDGESLNTVIKDAERFEHRLALLPHISAVADAIAYAHVRGIIHRDLKPANVLVGRFGETVVIDWGLAKEVSADDAPPPAEPTIEVPSPSAALTRAGTVLGTPYYMPPEQARGEAIDERADVYAIGAMLYHLLAGKPPFHGTGDVVSIVADGSAPDALAAVEPRVPRDLAAIVDRAMASAPDARYRTARELADDLRRFQTGQLVASHRYTAGQLVRRFVRRYRVVFAIVGLAAIALGVMAALSIVKIVDERDRARAAETRANAALDDAVHQRHELVKLQARSALAGDPTATVAWLASSELADADLDADRDLLDRARARGVASHVLRADTFVADAWPTPDVATVVMSGGHGLLRAYDLATGAMRAPPSSLARSNLRALALAPDGRVAVAGGTGGEVVTWPVAGGDERLLVERGARVTGVRFDARGERVLVERASGPASVVGLDGTIAAVGPADASRVAVAAADWSRWVALATPNQVVAGAGSAVVALPRSDGALDFVAVSADGTTVLAHDGETVWAAPASGGPLRAVARYPAEIGGVTWAPDNHTVAVFGRAPEIILVDVKAVTSRKLRGHTSTIYSVVFSRDGRRLLSASDDRTARLWNLDDGNSVELLGHDDDVRSARFSADEQSVVTAAMDRSVRVWPLARPGHRAYAEAGPIEHAWLERGKLAVQTAAAVARWDVATGTRLSEVAVTGELAATTRDGDTVILRGGDWTLDVRGKHAVVLVGHRGEITHVEIERDGRTAYSSSVDGTLRAWNLDTGRSTIVVDGKSPIRTFRRAPDGRMVVLYDASIAVSNARGDDRVLGTGAAWCANGAGFDHGHDRMFVEFCDGRLEVFEGGKPTALAHEPSSLGQLEFSDDDQLVAAVANDTRTIRVWRVTGEPVGVLDGHSDGIRDIAWSPGGHVLASASWDLTVRIWDPTDRTGAHVARSRALYGHAGPVSAVAWIDAAHLVSASQDGTLRVWDVPTLAPATRAEVTGAAAAMTTARIDGALRPTTTTTPPPTTPTTMPTSK
jgi:WD40 repeat protein